MAINENAVTDTLTPTTGTLNVSGAILPTTALSAAGGGTGLTSSGTSGNILVSNGTTWTSAANPAATPDQAYFLSFMMG